MLRDEAIKILKKLKERIILVEELDNENKILEEELKAVLEKNLQIDSDEKKKYINSRIGRKPKRPKFTFNFTEHKYNSSIYKNQMKLYKKQLEDAKKEYEKICDEKKNNQIAALKKRLEDIKCQLNDAKLQLNNDKTITEKLKSLKDVNRMIEFFEDGRADNLKEAINLCFDENRKDAEENAREEHRRTMEMWAERQYCEAEEAARIQRENAQKLEDINCRINN